MSDTPAALAALDLDAIKARRDAVMKLTFALAADGEKAFRMSIPLQQDDADVLLLKLCDDVSALLAAARQGEEDTDELSRLTDRLQNWLSLKEPDTYASRAEAFEWAARAHELAARRTPSTTAEDT